MTPMLLWCPSCGERHIDEGEFATKPHHTHACQHCGMVWRPALITTVGVRFLPGFKDNFDGQARGIRIDHHPNFDCERVLRGLVEGRPWREIRGTLKMSVERADKARDQLLREGLIREKKQSFQDSIGRWQERSTYIKVKKK